MRKLLTAVIHVKSVDITFEPRVIVAGQRYVGFVIVRTRKAEQVDSIYVHVSRTEAWRHGAGSHAPKARHEERLFEHTIAGPLTLAAGETRFPVAFVARADLPAPYRLSPVYTDYSGMVKVTRKGWFKAKHEFKLAELQVKTVPQAGTRGSPLTLTSDLRDPQAPRLEVGLPARCFAVGEHISGTVALFNVDVRSPRDVDITFTPVFELRGWKNPWSMDGHPITTRVSLPVGATATPFSFLLPKDQPPTLGGVTHSLDWKLRVEAKSLAVDTRLVIVPADTRLGAYGPAPGLTDSSDRALLATYAQRQGWQIVSSPGSDFVGDVAARWTIGPYSILVGVVHRGKQGRFVVVAIDLPPLAIARAALAGLLEWTDSRVIYEQPSPTFDDDTLDAIRATLDQTLRTIDRLRIAADATAAAYSPFR